MGVELSEISLVINEEITKCTQFMYNVWFGDSTPKFVS